MTATTAGTPHGHVVHLYEDDASLARQVVPHLGGGLAAGESVIVIATAAHLARFRDGLASDGIDVGAAVADQRLLLLDASEALAGFLVDGRPEPTRFDATIGSTIRRALGQGPVRAYGEMVDVLWGGGDVVAAMELESLWQDLQLQHPFTLYCAYAADAVGALDGGAVAVCGLHDQLVGRVDVSAPAPPATSRRFLPMPGAVRSARRFVLAAVPVASPRAEDIALAVSELATNAIRHVGSPFHVAVTDVGDRIRVAVTDPSVLPPIIRSPSPTTPGGRGVRIVATLADAWGVDQAGDGKLVWADFLR